MTHILVYRKQFWYADGLHSGTMVRSITRYTHLSVTQVFSTLIKEEVPCIISAHWTSMQLVGAKVSVTPTPWHTHTRTQNAHITHTHTHAHKMRTSHIHTQNVLYNDVTSQQDFSDLGPRVVIIILVVCYWKNSMWHVLPQSGES